MNYKELLKLLPKNPNEAFSDAQSIEPVEGGILLIEKHRVDFGYGSNYGSHIWFFRTPKEFVDFLPGLLFWDIAIHWDDNDRNYISYDDDIEEEEIDDEVEEEDDEECEVRIPIPFLKVHFFQAYTQV